MISPHRFLSGRARRAIAASVARFLLILLALLPSALAPGGDRGHGRAVIAGNPVVGMPPDPGSAPLPAVISTHSSGEAWVSAGAIDAINSYAYFVTNTFPGRLIKIRMGAGADPPVRVGSLILDFTEGFHGAILLDAASGHGYIACNSLPGKVLKMALGVGDALPTRVGICHFVSGESSIAAGFFDDAMGHAYFATRDAPVRVVMVATGEADSPPVRIGAIDLEGGTGWPTCAAIDATRRYAYMAHTSGQLVKIGLGEGAELPRRVGSLNLNQHALLQSIAIDEPGGYAYIGNQPGSVLKLALGEGDTLPTLLGVVPAVVNEIGFRSALIDAAGGYLYFDTTTGPGSVIKFKLGAGDALPTRLGALLLRPDEFELRGGVIDTGRGVACFGVSSTPSLAVKVALGTGDALPTRIGAALFAREDRYKCGALEGATGDLILGTDTAPGVVLRFHDYFATHRKAPTSSLILEPGEHHLRAAVIDEQDASTYFGTHTSPAQIVKVTFAEETGAPIRAGSLVLDEGENGITCGFADVASAYGHFGLQGGQVITVTLPEGDALPSRVGGIALGSGTMTVMECGFLDPDAGHAYFGLSVQDGVDATNKVARVALDAGGGAVTPLDELVLDPSDGRPTCAAIDRDEGIGYFGTNASQVVKVALRPPTSPLARLGAATLPSPATCLAIDAGPRRAYVGCLTPPTGGVAILDLDGPTDLPFVLTSLPIEANPALALLDPVRGFVHFGTDSVPGRVVKVGLSDRLERTLRGTRFVMPESGMVHDVRLYSHVGDGRARLAIYDDAAQRRLLWQSSEIPFDLDEGFVRAAVRDGIPNALTLEPGTYWAAWQVDTNDARPSVTHGELGDGILMWFDYGPFTSALTPSFVRTTDERWTQYLTYATSVGGSGVITF